jgi:hypothetical protein
MPTYLFKDKNTGEYYEEFMSISAYYLFCKEHPELERVVEAPSIVSGVTTKGKVPDGFKEVLSKVAEAHPTSTVAERHGRKSIKDVKTREIIKKHVDKVIKSG